MAQTIVLQLEDVEDSKLESQRAPQYAHPSRSD